MGFFGAFSVCFLLVCLGNFFFWLLGGFLLFCFGFVCLFILGSFLLGFSLGVWGFSFGFWLVFFTFCKG